MLYYALGARCSPGYIWSGRSLCAPAALRRLRWPLFGDILRVGAVARISIVADQPDRRAHHRAGRRRRRPDAVAGYGTGARLEYLLVPLVFGLGAPAGGAWSAPISAPASRERALRIALIGGAHGVRHDRDDRPRGGDLARGLARLFGNDPQMIAAGSAYLRMVGPAYGFFGLGLALYFASQGAGRLLWPLVGGLLRMLIAGRRLARAAPDRIGGWAFLALASGSRSTA